MVAGRQVFKGTHALIVKDPLGIAAEISLQIRDHEAETFSLRILTSFCTLTLHHFMYQYLRH